MGIFSDITADDATDIVFKAGEKVQFFINDADENLDQGYIKLDMTVTSGDYEGRTYVHFLKKTDKPEARKNLARFALAMWSEDQLADDKCSVGDLVGLTIEAKALAGREHNGKTYQNFAQWAKVED